MVTGGTSIPVLSDPTYGLPLVVSVAAASVVTWWALRRRFLPPELTPYPTRRAWMDRPDTVAFLAGERGEYLPAVELLGRRLGQVVFERYHLRLDDRRGLYRAEGVPDLPEVGTLGRLVDDLVRAFRSADRAESHNLGNGWHWLRRHRRAVAARDFERVTAEVVAALPLLEAA
jgi:hypothetical protein